MSESRSSAEERDGAEQLLASARARLAAAAAELALPDRLRLSDRQRILVSQLLARLVRSIEDELRTALAGAFPGDEAEGLRAALGSAHVEIALPILGPGAPLAEPGLIAALLRRAEEHRLQRQAGGDHGLLVELAGDGDAALAAEAMALLIAQSGRVDAFQEPLIARGDLSAELQHGLVWTVAAALRRYIVGRHGADPAAADEALAAAAAGLFAACDEGEGVDARSLRLARRLAETGRLDDSLAVRALAEGSLPLFLAAIALRAAVDLASAWEILSETGGRGVPLLLRAAGVARQPAGAILLALGGDEAAIAPQLDLYDATAEGEARRFLSLWRADPGYRAALGRIAA
jgi:uncharacterized protein (DUF2336 family)